MYLLAPSGVNETRNSVKRSIGVKIIHMLSQDHKNKNKEQYQMSDTLTRLIGKKLLVKNDKNEVAKTLPIVETFSNVIDSDLHFSFSVGFYESTGFDDLTDYSYMGELQL
ncbi:hypothetical protein EEL31_23855 [Brevibacillus laterosporus]|nr:hypothetical protein EEL31_23855 [Brevibacillus laterosporus]